MVEWLCGHGTQCPHIAEASEGDIANAQLAFDPPSSAVLDPFKELTLVVADDALNVEDVKSRQWSHCCRFVIR